MATAPEDATHAPGLEVGRVVPDRHDGQGIDGPDPAAEAGLHGVPEVPRARPYVQLGTDAGTAGPPAVPAVPAQPPAAARAATDPRFDGVGRDGPTALDAPGGHADRTGPVGELGQPPVDGRRRRRGRWAPRLALAATPVALLLIWAVISMFLRSSPHADVAPATPSGPGTVSTDPARTGPTTVPSAGTLSGSGTPATTTGASSSPATPSGSGATTAPAAPPGTAALPGAASSAAATLSASSSSGAAVSQTAGGTTSAAASVVTACAVGYSRASSSTGSFSANVTIHNNGGTDVVGWTLVFAFPGNQRITETTSATVSQTGQTVAVQNLSSAPTINAGGCSVTFGFTASVTGTNSNPTTFTLNGTTCKN